MKVCPRCARLYPHGGDCCPHDGEPLVPPTARRTGTRLGPYRVMGQLGGGSMGSVYRAEHVIIAKSVCLKVLHRDLMADPAIPQRLLVEARAASALRHPGIVDVTDFGHTPDGCPFVVMEYLDGETLEAVIVREGNLPARRALGITAQVCRAIHACHVAGIVHRDLKPANIMLLPVADELEPLAPRRPGSAPEEQVKILDFGLASVREATARLDASCEEQGFVAGSPTYMSPEQSFGRTGDARSDIYAIGVMLFEMLTGELPFDGETVTEVLCMHRNRAVPSMRRMRPDLYIPAEAEKVVATAMAKRPGDRYQSAQDFLIALSVAFGAELQTVEEAPPARVRTVAWGGGLTGIAG